MKSLFLLLLLSASCIINAQKPLLGRTFGPLPHLEYGTGDDRLGGAKMTYLDTGILVHITDSSGNDYRVQLSKNHSAFLPKNNFIEDTTAVKMDAYLSSSWRVDGNEKFDFVSLYLPEKLPYRSFHQIHPSRIVVDIFGLVSNTNWITQLKTAKEIRNVWYEQAEADVFRVFIELSHEQHWGHLIYYSGKTLVIRVSRQPEPLKLKNLKIAIDAGHGGVNTGAKGASGIAEKDYTIKIASGLADYLCRKGATVYMTRCSDTDYTMIDRALMIRNEEPDLLISIHLNSSSNKNAKGVSTYYRHIGFRRLSQFILDRMLDLELNNFGNIGAFNFTLNGPTEYPNCLVEVAFISNEEDEEKIVDPQFQKKAARQIARGIEDWLKHL
jgi:N-acetylmuramoyl-L-alanine amidase